jgi:hypothetical protein
VDHHRPDDVRGMLAYPFIADMTAASQTAAMCQLQTLRTLDADAH